MNQVGIRQGRLFPGGTDRLPHAAWHAWKDELASARSCGFDTIEWLFAADDYDRNPLWTEAGREEIRRRVAATGVHVGSVCADYFIVHPFFRVSTEARRQSVAVLSRLIVLGASVGIRIVVVPVLEASEIRNPTEIGQLLDCLQEPLELAAAHHVRLGLETELPGTENRALLSERRHPALGLCYDTGNATARGYDLAADLRLVAPYLCEVHVKDRKRNGPSLRLGLGDTDFAAFFEAASEIGYEGPLILETPPGDEPVVTAMAQLSFLKAHARAGG